ncbi:MAG: prepilin-type N-terminal cleavage/methylation domain-containing protein [bacterium]|nr:prepilin-type N-terminal cleavage/methylation domain-containing protein [bacterium]
MLQHTDKNSQGFSLIEVLVAIAILAGLSFVSTQLLWDTVTTRSKQVSIEGSSDNLRFFTQTLTKSIQSAKSVSIPDTSTIKVTAQPCRTLRFNSSLQTIEQAVDDSASCVPPTAGFQTLTKDQITVTFFEVSPVGDFPQAVTIKLQGTFKDGLGEHPIDFITTVSPRMNL